MAYAADLKSASSDCGFESHRPYHIPRRLPGELAQRRPASGFGPQAPYSSRAASRIIPCRISDSLAV